MYILASCGNQTFPDEIPALISTIVTMFKIFIPVILVILGMIDMSKAVVANEEKEMKEAQKRLIKRIIYAVLIFFIFALVQFIFGAIDKGNKQGSVSCLNCFINNKNCDSSDGSISTTP